ncbi:MAG TPA: NAD-dependent succinate-semialdehyde dehydrogenase [Gemmatimonadaceae bacterium]|jgi:succinate-semialdehyde dehydrogenase/glutarate-semialdehyde dehydrogenase
MTIATINPATGETLETFTPLTDLEIDAALGRAVQCFASWRRSTFAERSIAMLRAAEILESEKVTLGRMMTTEMGKPIAAAQAEAEKCASACRYYAENAQRFLSDERATTSGGEAWIAYQPLGVVLAIMPWNFPFWQVVRFVAPALMAGNVGLLKHASNVPRCALALADIFSRAGFPDGAFQTLLIESSAVEAIIADQRVAAVTLTGSEGAGRAVASAAGRNLKKSVLELGGSDPYVIMPSADLDKATATAVTARMINNGQSCIAAKRFIVHERIYDRFIDGFVKRVRSLRVGDPMDEATELGPLATSSIRNDLAKQVRATIEAGGRALTGGHAIDRPGFYYEPTVLCDIPNGSPADDQELFGPVASVWKARDIDDALQIANGTGFGLGASAWTNDESERARFARDIEAGLVFINGMVVSEPGLPFGGVKRSGYGRELGAFGIREFVNIKTIKLAADSRGSSIE